MTGFPRHTDETAHERYSQETGHERYTHETERDRSLDIAVTGMAGRFPGAADIPSWWQALLRGEILTTRLDRRTLLDAGESANVLDDPDYVPVRGLLDDADRFDHELFGISRREGELMDPQHRLMLEAAWTALEDAGCDPTAEPRVTGVYASASSSAYLRAMLTSNTLDAAGVEEALRANEPDYMATRIAYRLGLTGPALSVLTACSSSLVAVHLAVQALLNGECEQAVVVAAAVDFPQAGHVHLPGGILSASGECRPFDAEADGALAGSGVVAVVLRPYEDAVADGCDPYGVIIGTAVNNDGSAKAGYQAPSATGQEAVIRAALAAADIEADSLGYLEAHATGTRVGDPIEWSAASSVLRELGARPGGIAVGAVKANIGHLDAASGLVSLIKTLLVVREGEVPPVAGFRSLNPLLETDGSPLYVPTGRLAWDSGPGPRRAGVSSFGIGGTNAHVVVEQARPATGERNPTDRPVIVGQEQVRPAFREGAMTDERPLVRPATDQVLMLSAADPDALARAAHRLADRLPELRSVALADIAHTLATGRARLPHRTAVAGRTHQELADRLRTLAESVRGSEAAAATPAPVVLLLPGQGSQRPGMARPFQQALPGFDGALEECLGHFGPALAAQLRTALFDPEFPAGELARTELAQPALFCVEYAVATALTGLGLRPVALAGHSLGEITGAALSGVLGLADAAELVTVRGRAMQACPPGAMVSLVMGEERALELAERFSATSGHRLELAAVNTTESAVLAGPVEAVDAFQAWLGDRETARWLRTSHAFHTGMLDPAVVRLREAAAGITLGRPALPYLANATGTLVPAGSAVEAGAFAEQARSAVRFATGLAAIAEAFPGAVAVEAGPGKALSGMAEAAGLTAVALSPGRSERPGEETLLALAELWAMGLPVDPADLTGPGRPAHLPGYAFAGPRLLAPAAAVRTAVIAAPVAAPAEQEPVPAAEKTPAESVAGLWTDLLGSTGLSPDSDFFDLGGDSLLVVRLARRIGEDLGVRVPVRDLMTGSTLAQQTAVVETLLAAGDLR
ncbi:acyltransferase domain-containing protein [Streptomyces sp. ISL-98]|uniref:type I polyketide synthase n=1 Tax=Streptomyces sp. ISL-98 TaxID=2819192 RepID=UPI001BED2A7F|nr:beta-ketoacyl synthase N-terminal-like domain-containing protein [Streptomyces sp. ISL-98]MBT2508575.1 acyltransferase domain-containing protein [Streptomyces sp. ISL-98]